MSATRTLIGRAGWVWTPARVVSGALFLFIAHGVVAAGVLFPAPLHITREITSPFSNEKKVIDEYCHGNRVISISGRRTAIADHAKGEVTVIDFAAGTYSVTTFQSLARLHQGTTAAATPESQRQNWQVESRGGRAVGSRSGETFEAERQNAGARQRIRVTADRELRLSRAAAEALLGTGYPNTRDDAAEILLESLRAKERRVSANANQSPDAEYAFPLEYSNAFELDGQTIETRNVVLRVGSELPPPDLITVPPGARLVESEAVLARRLADELDRPSPTKH